MKHHSPRVPSIFDVGICPDTGQPLSESRQPPRLATFVQGPSAADNLPFDFGKYSGKTAYEIADIDPQYLVWLHTNVPARAGYVPGDLLNQILGRA
ncbi:MAG: hypothetical protein JZU60_02820 [Ilumatobacteraceae bacterium]|nr:hypothetical protein [Ilumatobacteraceae bacterium]